VTFPPFVLQAFAIIVMLAILSILIIVHEFGHFLVARFFKFQTPVFGFGLPFGPHWVMGHRWGTEFRFHYCCLVGGYVAIPELGDESNAKEENYGVPLKPFKKFPIWQRALVAFAGVGFNILFAYIVMFGMLTTMGQPSQAIIVHKLPVENPIAKNAGVQVQDRIFSIDHVKMPNVEDVIRYLGQHKAQEIVLTVERANNKVDIPVTTNTNGKIGMVLISDGPIKYQNIDGSLIDIASLSASKLWTVTVNMIDATGMMFQSIFSGGKSHQAGQPSMSIDDLHGVLAIVKIGADIAQQDWSQLIIFTILISLDLAIMNLIPWPALDGGHLAFMAYEAVRGKPVGERAQQEIVKWGFISLLLLMAVIMVNDIRALVTGKLDFKPKSQQSNQANPDKSSNDTRPNFNRALEAPKSK
jgi:regulator of sigma E protease